jgi:hypothetical protein
MMMIKYWLTAAFCLFAFGAQAACPNAAASLTIPVSGTIHVTTYDQNCNVLAPSQETLKLTGDGSVTPTSTPVMLVSIDATGWNVAAATGAAVGTTGGFAVTYTPNGITGTLPFTIGAPVLSISFGSP